MENYKQVRIQELMEYFDCSYEEALEIYYYEVANDL